MADFLFVCFVHTSTSTYMHTKVRCRHFLKRIIKIHNWKRKFFTYLEVICFLQQSLVWLMNVKMFPCFFFIYSLTPSFSFQTQYGSLFFQINWSCIQWNVRYILHLLLISHLLSFFYLLYSLFSKKQLVLLIYDIYFFILPQFSREKVSFLFHMTLTIDSF